MTGMIEVEGPDGLVVEFPAGTPQDVMTRAMRKRFNSTLTQAPAVSDARPSDFPDKGAFYDESIGAYRLIDNETAINPPTRGEAFSRGVADGGTLGSGDELRAAIHQGGMTYEGSLARQRMREGAAREAYPMTTLAGEVAGGIGTGGGVVAVGRKAIAPATSAIGKVARFTGAAGAGGSAYAYGEGEGGAVNRALEAPMGAGLGVVGGFAGHATGSALGRLYSIAVKRSHLYDRAAGRLTERGRDALAAAGVAKDDISDDLARRFAQMADDAAEPVEATARQSAADEFDIPLSQAQRTGDFRKFATEDALRTDSYGRVAGNRMRAFDDAQQEAIDASRERLAARTGGGGSDAPTAGEAVQSGVRRRASAEEARAAALFDQVPPGAAAVDLGTVQAIPGRIRNALLDEGIDLDNVSSVKGVLKQLDVTISKAPPGAVGVDFRQVEKVRVNMGKALRASTDGEARRALAISRNAIDDWYSDTLEQAIIAGDTQVRDKILKARGVYAKYKQLFGAGPRQGDRDAGKYIEKIIQDDLTPEEIARKIMGSSPRSTGQVGAGVRIARRLKKILGDGSPELNAIREASLRQAFSSTTGEAAGAQAASTQVRKFANSPLAKELFSEADRAELRRFSSVLRLTVPPKGATNPSGTAAKLMRGVQDAVQTAGTGTAFATGGLDAGIATGLMQRALGLLSGNAKVSRATGAAGRRPSAAAATGMFVGSQQSGAESVRP